MFLDTYFCSIWLQNLHSTHLVFDGGTSLSNRFHYHGSISNHNIQMRLYMPNHRSKIPKINPDHLDKRQIPCWFCIQYNLVWLKIHNLFNQMKKVVTETSWKVYVFGVVLARILPHSDWMRRDTEHLFVFNPNAGKCESE